MGLYVALEGAVSSVDNARFNRCTLGGAVGGRAGAGVCNSSCVTHPAMTDAEMACCQKMAGDCDMGSGNHSCCRDTMHRAPQHFIRPARLTIGSQSDVPLIAIAHRDVHDEISSDQNDAGFQLRVYPPGSLPLPLNSILRI
jgi:hypothetical protein